MKKLVLSALMMLSVGAYAEEKTDAKKSPLQIDMVVVKGGRFDMGSDDEAADRKPAHSVVLKDFSMGKYEVTQEQWEAVMGANPSKYDNCPACPVTNVSWDDIQTFIGKLNEMTGKHYRLPTEAEWEFAARGGIREDVKNMKKYSGKKLIQTIAWYEGNAKDRLHKVGRKKPNELELHDMTGNVEEWVNDWYGKDYFTKKEVNNPTGPDGGNSKVVRGGSWNSTKEDITVTRRAAYLPKSKSVYLGFRLAE